MISINLFFVFLTFTSFINEPLLIKDVENVLIVTEMNNIDAEIYKTCVPKIDTMYGEVVMTSCDTIPTYPGGTLKLLSLLSNKLNWPTITSKSRTQTSVYITFVINKEGNIGNICIYKQFVKKGLTELEEECVKIFSEMPKWEAARYNGKPVHFRFSLPIYFSKA